MAAKVWRVMADFRCSPLWHEFSEGLSNVAPEDAGISEALASEFSNWALRYEETFDASYPPDSGFADESSEEDFYSQGKRLARQLAQELGDAVQVFYVNRWTGQTHPVDS